MHPRVSGDLIPPPKKIKNELNNSKSFYKTVG